VGADEIILMTGPAGRTAPDSALDPRAPADQVLPPVAVPEPSERPEHSEGIVA
jgi:hypothetical protein